MANIGSKWTRWVGVGCSHGHLANPASLRTVLKFCESYKPERRFHLGDFTDQAAFRSGAFGTKDETASIKDDLTSGLRFLEEFRPTDLLNGNHEDRLWEKAGHHNEIVARAAQSVIQEIETLTNKLGCRYVDHYDITRSWIDWGDLRYFHGWMYNENAIRDHAEHFGRSCFAHLHTVGEAAGRRADCPVGHCVGSLAHIPEMHYALRRRSTARWSAGFAYGEGNGKHTTIHLCRGPSSAGGRWDLPL